MKQRGLFDEIERLEELTKLGDPLNILAEKIKWESFRPILKQIRIENPENIKNAGRKPFDEVMMFRVIILQSLYGLSDDQMEFQLKDRRSFERFVSAGDMQCQMRSRPIQCVNLPDEVINFSSSDSYLTTARFALL